MTNKSRRALVLASIEKIKAAEYVHRESMADPSADGDDREATRSQLDQAKYEFSYHWREVEVLLREPSLRELSDRASKLVAVRKSVGERGAS